MSEHIVRDVIASNADINVSDIDGETALIVAVSKESLSCVNALLSARVQLEHSDQAGKTALFHAIERANVKIVSALVTAGADVNTRDKSGMTTLMKAVTSHHSDAITIARILIDAKVDVDARDYCGYTAFLHATTSTIPLPFTVPPRTTHTRKTRRCIHAQPLMCPYPSTLPKHDISYHCPHSGCDHTNHDPTHRNATRSTSNTTSAHISCTHTLTTAASSFSTATTLVSLLLAAGAIHSADHDRIALHAAIRAHDCTLTRLLVASGVDVDARDGFERTPLLMVARYGCAASADALLRGGASLDGVGEVLWTALKARNSQVVRILLDAGVDVEMRYSDRRTPILIAAKYGCIATATVLLDACANVHATGVRGETALFHAVQRNRLDLVCALLRADASVRVQDKHGHSPLLGAISCANVSIVAVLLATLVGVDVDMYTPVLVTPSAHTQFPVHDQACNTVCVGVCGNICATRHGSDICNKNAEEGVNHHGKCKRTNKPPSLSWSTIQALLCEVRTAAIQWSEEDSYLHLRHAIHRGRAAVVRMLVDAGVDVNAIERSTRRTPLIDAAEMGRTACIRVLLLAGACLFTRCARGRTALWAAVEKGRTDAVAALIEAKADITEADEEGRTALIKAANGGHTGIVRILVDAGVDIRVKDVYEWPAWAYAKTNGHRDCADILKESAFITGWDMCDNKWVDDVTHNDAPNDIQGHHIDTGIGTGTEGYDNNKVPGTAYDPVIETIERSVSAHNHENDTIPDRGVRSDHSSLSTRVEGDALNSSENVRTHNLEDEYNMVFFSTEAMSSATDGDTTACSHTPFLHTSSHIIASATASDGIPSPPTTTAKQVPVCPFQSSQSMLPSHTTAAKLGDITLALSHAVRKGDVITVRMLLSTLTMALVRSRGGYANLTILTPESIVMCEGVVHGILAKTHVRARDWKGLLLEAALQSDIALLKALISIRATQETQDVANTCTHTPMCTFDDGAWSLIARQCVPELLHLLVSTGVFKSLPAAFHSPVTSALYDNERRVAATLMHAAHALDDEDLSALFAIVLDAAMRGDVKAIDALVNAGVDVDIRDDQRQTVLMRYLHKRPHVAVVKALLRGQADVHATCEDGATPLLHLVSSWQYPGERARVEVAEVLITAGACVHARCRHGMTPLLYVARERHVCLYSVLARVGADIEARDEDGATALMLCCSFCEYGVRHRCGNVAESLLRLRVNVDARDNEGKTALLRAIVDEDACMVCLLLNTGADTTMHDDTGATALMYSQQLTEEADKSFGRTLRRALYQNLDSSIPR